MDWLHGPRSDRPDSDMGHFRGAVQGGHPTGERCGPIGARGGARWVMASVELQSPAAKTRTGLPALATRIGEGGGQLRAAAFTALVRPITPSDGVAVIHQAVDFSFPCPWLLASLYNLRE